MDPAEVKPQIEEKTEDETKRIPMFNVILLDDNDHTYDYVIEMLCGLFGHDNTTAYKMACEVDSSGSVIVDTTHRERAELKKDQIQSYGPDWRLLHSQGSMAAAIRSCGGDK